MPPLPPPFDMAWFRFILGFVVGASLGSFGTMLAYRAPRRLSIIMPRSHCPSCGMNLRIRDLVPMLSFLSTGGKCRYCHASIGMRYMWIELGCSLTGGVAAIALGWIF